MSVIQAGNTTTTSLIYTGDTTGNLVFTTGGANTTALTLSNTQAATFSGPISLANTLSVTGNATFSGYVNSPAQPKFFGYRTAGLVSATTTVLHNVVVTNVGSCYNSSTGIFTCPIAGYYEVLAGGHAENSQPTILDIQQNGTAVGQEYSNGSLYGSTTVFVIVLCAAGDQLKSVVTTGTFWGGGISGLRMSVKYLG